MFQPDLRHPPIRLFLTAFLMSAVLMSAGAVAEPAAPIDFSRDVRPILANYCFPCHGPDDKARKAGLRLDTQHGATAELPSGNRAIIPGKPGDCAALERIRDQDPSAVMPPAKLGKKPKAAEVEILTRWIEQGARYATHWAYVPPVRHPLPAVDDRSWPKDAIDNFILARLDRERLRPAPPADRHTLLRRAALDLTGLPPSPEEIDRFQNDRAPDAYERAVDALLAKPADGERWAAVWLDLARYGDSSGYIHDPPRTIWRWRDWLIRALNDNMPYDRFTTELLAGDLIAGAAHETKIATGFHRNTTTNTEGGANAEEYRFAAVVDRVNTTMQVWMGTTFGCAQCHNHKYDPFTQKEYYQVFAVFNNTADVNTEEPTLLAPRVGRQAEFDDLSAQLAGARVRLEEEARKVDAKQPAWEKSVDLAHLPQDVVEILKLPAGKRSPAQVAAIVAYHRSQSRDWSARDAAVKRLAAELDRVATTTLVMKEGAERPTHVAIRGEYQNRGEPVKPGLPAALHGAPAGIKLDRLGLARWLVDPDNPLTARVAVNRLWQEIFGVGIVETSEEFGTQGEPPSHPELLDWLATEYVRLGWDTKRLLKQIVTSATYRQRSQASDRLARLDPYNRLLARGPRVRLTAESLRDCALASSGLLSPKMYGPPVHPFQPVNGLAAAFGASTDWQTSPGDDSHRRALYTRWRRNLPYPSMIAFDVPERAVCSMRRLRTNTPIQALVTLNDPVFVEAAQALARRIMTDGGQTFSSRAAFGFNLVLARPPADAESNRLVALFQAARSSLAAEPTRAALLATKPAGPLPPEIDALDAAAWTVVGNVLLNLDESLTKR
jgi:hypothetical protein